MIIIDVGDQAHYLVQLCDMGDIYDSTLVWQDYENEYYFTGPAIPFVYVSDTNLS